MGYPNYVWIVPKYPDLGWAEDSSSTAVSEAFLFGTIEISLYPINMEENTITISGKVTKLHFTSKYETCSLFIVNCL